MPNSRSPTLRRITELPNTLSPSGSATSSESHLPRKNSSRSPAGHHDHSYPSPSQFDVRGADKRSNTARLSPAVGELTQPPLKKMRRIESGPSDMEEDGEADGSCPSETSSQERKAGKGKDRDSEDAANLSTFAAPAPKKKRTRTLTTPHQSAVLHALLAQSRFPSTAVREAVGQSIGLSARKVQIWFQNQRQKARRPRSQSEASLTQRAPYDSVSTGSSSGPRFLPAAFGSASTSSSSMMGHPQFPVPERQRDRAYSDMDPHLISLNPGPHLLGPGVPGLVGGSRRNDSSTEESRRSSNSSLQAPAMTSIEADASSSRLPSYRPSTSSSTRILSPVPARLYDSDEGILGPDRDRDASRKLPPLTLGVHTRHAPGSQYHAVRQSKPVLPLLQPSLHHDVHQAHPSSQSEQTAGHRLSFVLPPPITLQPEPIWDTAPSLPPFKLRVSPTCDSGTAFRNAEGSPALNRDDELVQFRRSSLPPPSILSRGLESQRDVQPGQLHRFDPVRSSMEYPEPQRRR